MAIHIKPCNPPHESSFPICLAQEQPEIKPQGQKNLLETCVHLSMTDRECWTTFKE